MRMRRNSEGDEAEVILSPLIDCVFLLLIFFLVTSMIKRWERQIPVTLADPSAAVAVEAEADAYLIGVDTVGRVHRAAGNDWRGILRFKPVADVNAFLAEIQAKQGLTRPIELVVERETPFQTLIDVLDRLELAGFTDVRYRVRDTEL